VKSEAPEPASVSAVIVNFQSYELVVGCVAALEAGTARIPREIIVVDNSQDESGRALWGRPETNKRFEWIFNSANVGFAAACNQGIVRARGDHLLLINPDSVVHERTVDTMAELIDCHPELAAVGAQLLNPDGTLQPSAYQLYPGLLRAFLDLTGLRYAWLYIRRRRPTAADSDGKALAPAAWLKGACVMLRREAFETVGPLDEGFFLFGEDVDWCFRARRAGWQIALATGCFCTHAGERSMSKDRLRGISAYYQSYLRFILKHQGSGPFGLRAAAARSLLMLGAATRFVAFAAASLFAPERRSEAHAYWRYLTAH
jgi:N-acetylglucosaminyl-diphospho-decaprenol L-rhamnosyltransferase